jgi:hypothetical protein
MALLHGGSRRLGDVLVLDSLWVRGSTEDGVLGRTDTVSLLPRLLLFSANVTESLDAAGRIQYKNEVVHVVPELDSARGGLLNYVRYVEGCDMEGMDGFRVSCFGYRDVVFVGSKG